MTTTNADVLMLETPIEEFFRNGGCLIDNLANHIEICNDYPKLFKKLLEEIKSAKILVTAINIEKENIGNIYLTVEEKARSEERKTEYIDKYLTLRVRIVTYFGCLVGVIDNKIKNCDISNAQGNINKLNTNALEECLRFFKEQDGLGGANPPAKPMANLNEIIVRLKAYRKIQSRIGVTKTVVATAVNHQFSLPLEEVA